MHSFTKKFVHSLSKPIPLRHKFSQARPHFSLIVTVFFLSEQVQYERLASVLPQKPWQIQNFNQVTTPKTTYHDHRLRNTIPQRPPVSLCLSNTASLYICLSSDFRLVMWSRLQQLHVSCSSHSARVKTAFSLSALREGPQALQPQTGETPSRDRPCRSWTDGMTNVRFCLCAHFGMKGTIHLERKLPWKALTAIRTVITFPRMKPKWRN